MVLLLFAAGHDTTVAFLSNSALALMANPEQWKAVRADPATLDLTRAGGGTGGGHLAFGHGIHHRIGAPLARLEGRIALRALSDRFPDLRLSVPAAALWREPALLADKLTALPVRNR